MIIAILNEALLSVPLRVQSSQSLIPLALEIACGENRTVSDSLYLAAAIVHQFPVVTAEAKLYRALRRGPSLSSSALDRGYPAIDPFVCFLGS
jgi:predicted nucleic acid-binding protein